MESMENAFGLVFNTLLWFSQAFIFMFVRPTVELLLLIPFTGMFALISGAVLWFHDRRKSLLFFLASPLASLLFVFIAGFFHGTLDDKTATYLLIGFLTIQAVFLLYAFYRCRLNWMPAALLTYGFATFALFSALISGMSFQDSWI